MQFENNLIVEYSNKSNRQLADLFGKSVSQIKNIATKYKLKKSQDYKRVVLRNDCWSRNDLDVLNRLYPNTSNKVIAEQLCRTVSMIKNKAFQLKLKKDITFSNSGRFDKGHVPWSKGKKGLRMSPDTEFKKGMRPWNTKHDGCITVRFDKSKSRPYKFIRIENNKWVFLHRYIYEKYIGSIPKEKVIIFKDGNSMNLNFDNLIPVSRSELLSKNRSNRFKDPQKLYAYLTKKLTRLSRRAEEKEEARKQREILRADRLSRRAEEKEEARKQREILRADRLSRRAKEIKRNKINKKRITDGFIETKLSSNFLLELGEKHLGLAKKFMNDADGAKDAIMNTICYFIEGNVEASSEEFNKRLIYECKLLKKDSYKMVSFNDLEYKLTELAEF